MRKFICIILSIMFLCVACDFKLKSNDETLVALSTKVQRYDRLQCRYLTTGDYSALQLMSTDYPKETRTLVEDMLQLGEVNEPHIYEKLLNFYQDSTLQAIIVDADAQYADISDIENALNIAFGKLETWLPKFRYPVVYTQIGALNQSIVIGDSLIGISLDKYLGSEYPAYKKFYDEAQRKTMNRGNIVPDCIVFYLLSLYPIADFDSRTQAEKDYHMGKVMWIANKALATTPMFGSTEGCSAFETADVKAVDHYMIKHPGTTIEQLLTTSQQ